MSVVSLRRLAVAAWGASAALIVLAAVLLLVGGGEPVDPSGVDLGVQRDVRQRTVSLGAVGLVAVLGAVSFGAGAALRLRADEAERRETSAGFGVRPARPPRPTRGTITPPSRGSHDDLLKRPPGPTDGPATPPTPPTPENPDETDREQR